MKELNGCLPNAPSQDHCNVPVHTGFHQSRAEDRLVASGRRNLEEFVGTWGLPRRPALSLQLRRTDRAGGGKAQAGR
jgi:hypothetical protein